MKKVVCLWVSHNLTEHQKEEVSESVKKSLKLPNDGGHHVIAKIVMDDETNMPFYDIPTRQRDPRIQGVPGSLGQTLRRGRGHDKNSDLHNNPWSEMSSFSARWRCSQ
ncbi:hypothetical protein TNCV_1712531 [Trichonephila clavipes]|nr:hypothetical protein TNCV_1712531 [Trichonephila clavipes]